MAFYIQDTGVNTIFNSTAVGPGQWYRIHHKITEMAFQATISGTTAGSTVSVGAVVAIEQSVDGVNPMITKLGTITISSVTAVSPAADGFGSTVGMGAQYVRANLTSLSTGIVVVATSAKMRR